MRFFKIGLIIAISSCMVANPAFSKNDKDKEQNIGKSKEYQSSKTKDIDKKTRDNDKTKDYYDGRDKDRNNDKTKDYYDGRDKDRNNDRTKDYYDGRDKDRNNDRTKDYYDGRDKDRYDSKGKGLPPGLQKKVDQGKPLPPGWQKKLAKGDILSRDIYDRGRVVVPVGKDGSVSVDVDGTVIRLYENTREIIDILKR
ncbi:hypothetical protein [Shewanella aestuarii]|uniref:hypothetical protein n=1 Tax=Shewanella aestuarii TaxID=1028752 RepID=UPI001FCC0DC1|nr:hypothetical protein [Shewanella aestuarii]